MLEFFNIIARAYPMIIIFVVLGHFLGTKNPESIYLFTWLVFIAVLNEIMKRGIKGIFGSKNFPFFLGNGQRPAEAKNCGIIEDGEKNTSYGMPSGHSQFAAFFSIYSILVINNYPLTDTVKTTFAILLTFIAFWVMHSRMKIKCHTLQQVIMGGLFGSIFGIIAYNLKNTILIKIK